MVIGVLMGKGHFFMDDLESFFWVLFWLCIHYNSPNERRSVKRFEKWNTEDAEELARLKLGTISKRRYFTNTVSAHFTPYYRPLIPWVVKLRDVVFPNNGNWEQEDKTLYSQMRQIFRDGQNDSQVLAD
ncbi:hypothetical protein F5Y03DRAFT_399118 [Xylaria venustula]|nr:hypothetical protein F5Y03DRAFT_399118 [Xylaria venustula]